ncbi:MAG: hypothetical protein B9S26_13615 [Opitutia bacterium Tous-C4FEB]|nr:MAG: hypothetical protein B9S35_09775 [Opitutae bacterium Tous-C5TDCM]PAW87678.1 MAG: hypothetical protein B9S26_13615 [Opitutae bacterium Tous-C4FEB]
MNATASNPSLSVAASVSRSNTSGIHPDGQGDADCYNPPFNDSDTGKCRAVSELELALAA